MRRFYVEYFTLLYHQFSLLKTAIERRTIYSSFYTLAYSLLCIQNSVRNIVDVGTVQYYEVKMQTQHIHALHTQYTYYIYFYLHGWKNIYTYSDLFFFLEKDEEVSTKCNLSTHHAFFNQPNYKITPQSETDPRLNTFPAPSPPLTFSLSLALWNSWRLKRR